MKLKIKHAAAAFALFALSSTAFANTPICNSAASDSDNDGWGWENGESCMVAVDTSVQAPTVSAVQPVCTSNNADPDGDGWGWENNASCVVLSSSASTPSALSDTSFCNSAAADPDGDGWGWENNQSCMVAPASTAASSDTTGSVGEITAISIPAQCSSAAADPDGDGWGWENNQSCMVVALAPNNTQTDTTEPTAPDPAPVVPAPVPPVVAQPQIPVVVEPAPAILPPCSIPALDTDNDGIGRENNQDCTVDTPINVRIMALGDSITHGSSTARAESYRKPFITLMTSSSCQFEMVGSQSGNYLHDTFISPHEGYNGHTADEILNGHVDNAGNNEGISVTANRYQPHVVLLHIGSNDMKLGQDFDQTVGEIDQIISLILATDSTPVVLLANVIPWPGDATTNARVEVLGDRIEAYVAQLSNPRVRTVDVRTGFENSMILSDGIHPNPAGEQHIAERFLEAYTRAGFCR